MENNINYITASGRLPGKTKTDYGPVSRDVYILHYVINGKGYLDFGNNHITVKSGESFLIRPFMTVHYYSDDEDPWEYAWVDFRGDDFERLVNKIHFIKNNSIIGAVNSKYVLPYIDTIYAEYKNPQRYNFCNGLLTALLGIYIDIYPIGSDNDYAKKFLLAKNLIFTNYGRPDFSIKEIAAALDISNASLYRLFADFAGISPNKYLMNFRITTAKNLLDTDKKIKDVAILCGFDDPLYFSRVFKQIVRISPKAYQNRNRSRDCGQETYYFT